MKCCFLNFIKHLIETIIFSLVIGLCALSSKEPFKSHFIGDITDYFLIVPNASFSVENICICDNITFGHSCTEENILEGCLNNISDIIDFKSLSKRNLASDSFCIDMQESFIRNKGNKLSYIFNFRYQAIRKISIALTIVFLSFIPLSIILSFILKKESNKKKLIIISILILIFYIAKFVLSLILFYFIESGDIGKYNDFLDCKNVRKEFFKQFKDIVRLRQTFLAFGVFNIISEAIDKVKELFENDKKVEPINPGVVQGNTTLNV